MCTKGVFASWCKDVEKGNIEDAENQRPLLEANGRPGRLPPERPAALGLTISTDHPQYTPPIPPLPDETPSSVSSAVNTPQETTVCKQWRRSDRRLRRLNTELLEAIEAHNPEEVERLLNKGANANATCRLDLVSACHTAAINGGDTLTLLIKFGAEKLRIDRLGRTPLHLAAYAGHAKEVAILLDFPEGRIEELIKALIDEDLCRTPLRLDAYAGHINELDILLNF